LLSRDGSDLRRHAAQAERVEALAYRLRPESRALIIGPGGGNDVIMARLFGARQITGVEVNPIIARDIMLSEPFLGYSGRLYLQPSVRLVVDEGRSFVRASRERYDVIQGTMVDTWAATAAGAFALTENNLYTVEAFTDYVGHLTERGVLSMTRWYLEPPDQLLRLFALARVTMTQMGIDHADRHLMLVRGPAEPGTTRAPTTFLFGRGEFALEEASHVEAVARREGFTVLYTPFDRPPNLFTRLAEAEDPAAVWAAYENDVSPPTDNRPFFFNTVRPGNVGAALGSAGEWRKTNLGTFVLFSLLAITVVLTLAFILGPLAIAVVLLAPLGLVMGMPMPIGVRVLNREAPSLIPWAWGVNGAASVMGSAAALAVALLAGFNQAMLMGAALYLLALACQRRGWEPS